MKRSLISLAALAVAQDASRRKVQELRGPGFTAVSLDGLRTVTEPQERIVEDAVRDMLADLRLRQHQPQHQDAQALPSGVSPPPPAR
jgi:hypothetical protein